MKLALRDIEVFIKANNVKEVTNPVIMNQGFVPTSDGLLSTTIFGTTTKERKYNYGFIRLNGHFLHPLVYKNIKRMDRRIDSIIAGTKKYIINKQGLLEENEAGNTGLEWLYNNWEKIKFKDTGSNARAKRVTFLNTHPKTVLFQEYEIVQPAFYRDINLQAIEKGKPSIHEINRPYSKLIRLASSLKMSGDYNFVLNNTRFQIQSTLVEIYDYFKTKIERKHGIIRKSILGKSVDYGARMVIAAPNYDVNYYKDMPIDFYHSGIPLASCCVMALPFFIGWIQGFIQREFELTGYKYPVYNHKTKQVDYVKLKNPELTFNDEYITKMINKYVYSYSDRFELIPLPNEEDRKIYLSFKGKSVNTQEYDPKTGLGGRPMTITDLLYLAAVDIYKDKHVYITRYPITDFMSIFPTKVTVLSTNRTVTMKLNGKTYPFYPDVDLSMSKDDVSKYFIDVLKMQNVYLDVIGGDYDGDTISCRTVFSQEANIEADRILKSKINILNVNGNNIRKSKNEAIQTLHMITKD